MSVTLQKANFWKRISAYLFDLILTVTIVMAFAAGLSIALNYDSHNKKLQQFYTNYEQEYGIELDISQEEYNQLSAEEQTEYMQLRNECLKAINDDPQVQQAMSTIFKLSFAIISISVLLSILAMYFLIPLFFRNGQTLGKKMFGIGVVRSNCVKASNLVLFVRSILGLYTIETMFPVLLVLLIYFGILGSVGTITLLMFFCLQIGVMIKTQDNCSIHDLLSDTVVVEMVSQTIFESQEALLEYQKAQAAEEANAPEQASMSASEYQDVKNSSN